MFEIFANNPIKRISRISPSRFHSLGKCLLRETWSASKMPPALPSSPASNLGNIIHKLLEESGTGQIEDSSQIENRFSALLENEVQFISKTPLISHLANLEQTVRDFAVRRSLALSRAKQIWIPPLKEPKSGPKAFERWLESKDKVVGGFIDQIVESQGKVTIKDFKTGDILESDSKQIKKEYEVQLSLYSALYFETYNKWPDRLELVPLNGEPHEVKLSPGQATQILLLAKQKFDEANSKIDIASKMTDQFQAKASLGTIGDHCRLCPYRPACPSFMNDLKTKGINNGDLIGCLEKKYQFGNGLNGMKINVLGKYITIKGLTPSTTRHPYFEKCNEGSCVSAFNLSGLSKDTSRSESLYTTIIPL